MSSSSAAYTPLHPHRRQPAPGLLLSHGPPIVAAVFLVLTLVMSVLPSTTSPSPSSSSSSSSSAFSTEPNRNGVSPLPRSMHNNLALSPSTCSREFPLLYPQLEELQAHWRSKGGISSSHIDALERAASSQNRWGWARVIIRDGRMYIRSLRKGPDTRLVAMLMLLHDAIKADPGGWSSAPSGDVGDLLPPLDLILSVGDRDGFPGEASGPAWVLTKATQDGSTRGNWLSPDFGFLGWPEARSPSHAEVVELNRQVEERIGGWNNKDDRAFWRGFPNWYPIRADLLQRTKAASLLPPDHPDAWADIFATTFGGNEDGSFQPLVPVEEHCTRKYLVHSEGNSYSGRSKYLFSCHSVTIAHKLEWAQHFHPALISDPTSLDQNYVQVSGPGFDGLEEAVRGMWEADGDKKSNGVEGWLGRARSKGMVGRLPPREVADNARDSLRDRYLTPAATACYYRAALHAYASVLNNSTWSPLGPTPRPGNGIPPLRAGVGPPFVGDPGAEGDISFDSWSLIRMEAKGEHARSDWPPPPPHPPPPPP